MTFLDARGRWDDNCYVTKRPTIYPTKYRYLRKNDCLQYTNLEMQKNTASGPAFCQVRGGVFSEVLINQPFSEVLGKK